MKKMNNATLHIESAGRVEADCIHGYDSLRSTSSWELLLAIKNAENDLEFKIPIEVTEKVLAYAKRKFEVIQANEDKPDDYLPILFESELLDYFRRFAVNALSEEWRKNEI